MQHHPITEKRFWNKNHKKIPSRKPPEGIFYSFIALKIRNSLQISLFFFSLPLLQRVLLPGKALPFLLHLMYHQSWLLSLHLMYHLQYRYWMIHCWKNHYYLIRYSHCRCYFRHYYRIRYYRLSCHHPYCCRPSYHHLLLSGLLLLLLQPVLLHQSHPELHLNSEELHLPHRLLTEELQVMLLYTYL